MWGCSGASAIELRNKAMEEGMIGLRQSGLQKIRDGITTIEEVYRVGGAQAIGALAFGTETIPKVDKIVGPGNAYVAAAKRRVYGAVGIDMIAGPSEILVVCDGSAK